MPRIFFAQKILLLNKKNYDISVSHIRLLYGIVSHSSYMKHSIYISYSNRDANIAQEIATAIEASGIKCWIAKRDILPGSQWGEEITHAIKKSSLLLVILSSNSASSNMVGHEVEVAYKQNIKIVPVLVEKIRMSYSLSHILDRIVSFDASELPLNQYLPKLVEELHALIPSKAIFPPDSLISKQALAPPKSKGYVFISYMSDDLELVGRLTEFLKAKGYAYWEYYDSDRDYHGILYRELEEKIDGAAAFMCIVSDSWRVSEWTASEYIYAKEAKIPIFVIQARKLEKPMPILLNLHTRIDMSGDYDKALLILENELKKKNL